MIVNDSWLELSPYGKLINTEPLYEYLARIDSYVKYHHIPHDVLKQWNYLHHDNEWMVKNYAWIDFTSIKFKLVERSLSMLKSVKVIEPFQNCISDIEDKFNSVSALPDDKYHWDKFGTWRVPPIVMDTRTFIHLAPSYSELHIPHQLIEGHSRMRNLLISSFQNLPLTKKHFLYLMTSK